VDGEVLAAIKGTRNKDPKRESCQGRRVGLRRIGTKKSKARVGKLHRARRRAAREKGGMCRPTCRKGVLTGTGRRPRASRFRGRADVGAGCDSRSLDGEGSNQTKFEAGLGGSFAALSLLLANANFSSRCRPPELRMDEEG